MGYLYRPTLKGGKRSSVWWAKYYSFVPARSA